jgi:biotin transport system substrate-specific component
LLYIARQSHQSNYSLAIEIIMNNIREYRKPNPEIEDREWEFTPLIVKIAIEDLKMRLDRSQKKVDELQKENKWLRDESESVSPKAQKDKPPLVSPPEIILWSTIGLLLTIGGAFVQGATITPPWEWLQNGVRTETIGVSYQIAAVLSIACLGGRFAGVFSQIAYLLIGLLWLPIFDRGGGIEYVREPAFGYILGFVFGAFCCGYFAFRSRTRLHNLALSCLSGLATIHLTGIVYLFVLDKLKVLSSDLSWLEAVSKYSIAPLPGQLILLCAVTLITFGVRKLIFY